MISRRLELVLAGNTLNIQTATVGLFLGILLLIGTIGRCGDQSSLSVRKVFSNPTVVLAVDLSHEQVEPRTPEDTRGLANPDRLRPIEDIALPLRADFDRMPPDMAARRFGTEPGVVQHGGASRFWESSLYNWEAPALCHRPLYFEDENLERHGRSLGILQPAASTAHACGRLAALPYLMGVTSPHECVYTLGKERPGTCGSYYWYRPPVSLCGALYEAGAVTGLAFIVP